MGLRELKEVAHEQFVRGKFAQCAQTYGQVLRLAPKDPNMRVRHAEACRRAGDKLQAIASYRAAAELLLELGCESRSRGALKAALELDPKDPLLLADIAALAPQGIMSDLERASLDFCEADGPPALPPLHRALPMAPLTPPPAPPVLLAVPGPLSPEALRPPGIRPLVPSPPPGPTPRARAPTPAMEVRRLSPTTLAFRLSPQDSWVLVRARTPLDMHMVADLETFRPDSHEFTLDITVDSQDEAASRAAP